MFNLWKLQITSDHSIFFSLKIPLHLAWLGRECEEDLSLFIHSAGLMSKESNVIVIPL